MKTFQVSLFKGPIERNFLLLGERQANKQTNKQANKTHDRRRTTTEAGKQAEGSPGTQLMAT